MLKVGWVGYGGSSIEVEKLILEPGAVIIEYIINIRKTSRGYFQSCLQACP